MKLKTLIKNPSNIIRIAVIVIVLGLLAASFAAAYPKLFFVTVEFYTDYGTPIEAVRLRYGGILTDIPVTAREYNTFGGWYLDKEHSLPYTGGKLNGNTTLYARWNTIFDEQYFESLSQRLSISVRDMGYQSFFDEDMGEILLSNNLLDLSVYADKRIYSGFAECDGVGVLALFSIVFADRQDAVQVGEVILASQSGRGDIEVFALDTCLIGIPYGMADIIFGEQTYSDNDYYYLANKENTRLTILKYKGQDAFAEIPTHYNGIPVTSIGAYAFCNSSITGVSIPQGVQTIGFMSFASCNNLQEITLPASVERIGDGFAAKKSGFAKVNVPSDMQNYYYNDDALYEKSGRLLMYGGTDRTVFDVQEGTKTISCYAFAGHSELTEIRLAEDLTNINEYAFFDCSGIEEYNIPASVYGINEFAFAGVQGGNTSLKRVNFADESNLIEINFAAFANNPNLEKFVLKKGLRVLSDNLLANCTGLTTVIFEDGISLHTIQQNGLANCTSLTNIILPDSVTEILERAFENCISLKSINIGNAAKIGDYAMYGCVSLEAIEYSDGLEINEIGMFAFADCIALTEFGLPIINTIRDYAFSGCGFVSLNLTRVGSLNYRAFADCKSLTEIMIGGEGSSIGSEVFLGCDSVKKVELQSGYKSPLNNSILGGFNNVEEIIMPIIKSKDNNYTQIHQLFWGSVPQSLRIIRISNDIAEIPNWYFGEYANITEVYLPQTIQSIGEGRLLGVRRLPM